MTALGLAGRSAATGDPSARTEFAPDSYSYFHVGARSFGIATGGYTFSVSHGVHRLAGPSGTPSWTCPELWDVSLVMP